MFEPITISKNDWRVVLSYDGEGYSGPYRQGKDPVSKDVMDDPMVRYTVFKKVGGKFVPVKDATRVTYLRATDSPDILQQAAVILVQECVNYKDEMPLRMFWDKLATIHLHRKQARLLPAFGSPQKTDE